MTDPMLELATVALRAAVVVLLVGVPMSFVVAHKANAKTAEAFAEMVAAASATLFAIAVLFGLLAP